MISDRKRLLNLSDALGEDILAASDEELLIEAQEDAAEQLKSQREEIGELLEELYPDGAGDEWLDSPQKLLGGRTPGELLGQDRAEDVLRLLRQISDGAYL
jgi:hypothetical protein